jgi:tetratricopeptide (TPR) repeat protein
MVLLALALAGGCRKAAVIGGTPEQVLASGWDLFRLGEFDRATPVFEQAVATAPAASEAHARALYALATVWNLRRPDDDRKKAASYYRRLIDEHPTSTWAAWSTLALARQIQVEGVETLPPIAQLEEAYGQVIANYPGHAAADEAYLFIQAAKLLRTEDELTAVAVSQLQGFVAEHADSPYVSAAWGLLAHGYFLQHKGQARVDALVKAWETGLASAVKGDITRDPALTYFGIATAAQFDAGDFATARRFYRKLIAEFPNEQKSFVSKQQLQRMDDLEASIRAGLAAAKGGEARP